MRIKDERAPKELARELRKRETEAEQELWKYLRSRRLAGFKFYRQHPIGDYVADFCCRKPPLVIELDGNPHLSRAQEDQRRTHVLNEKGYKVLRFWNSDVLKKTPVIAEIILKTLDSLI